jgi:hypothetical protein
MASPDLPPARADSAGPAPRLLPTAQILDAADAEGDDLTGAERAAPPLARASSLRARAAALRGPVFAPDERARLVAQPPATR